ncbi:MAG: Ig-like domain-containing protein [Lachnospiraceae bacterium]|nr:Ig-like domain-containing protein [Lachnospiraceae bacterium]
MYYALGDDNKNVPEENSFNTEIPVAKDAGTYYVWYKVKGDENYNDTEAICLEVKIEEKAIETSKPTDEPNNTSSPTEQNPGNSAEPGDTADSPNNSSSANATISNATVSNATVSNVTTGANVASGAATNEPKLENTSFKLKAGKKAQINVLNASGAAITYTSSNKKIAKVSKKGKITAMKKGSATISVVVGSKTLTCEVSVISNPKLKKKSVKIKRGTKKAISVKIVGGVKVKVKNASKLKNIFKFKATKKKLKIKPKKLQTGKYKVKVVINGVNCKLKITVS